MYEAPLDDIARDEREYIGEDDKLKNPDVSEFNLTNIVSYIVFDNAVERE